MARQHHIVDQGNVVADLAIMADMGGHHEIAVGADAGVAAALRRAHMHGHMLPQHAVGPKAEGGRLAAIAQVLGSVA